uniref:Ig-like domain-containing protein n=1 Tax=Octopus bimaculoides TaxID=37653 RepID=A0A0L8FP14_OCTBM|eukprot:XP_014788121.1 PREDICTED: uncharacterized protein LOC106882073 [Octopus bimaculoides]
MSTMLSAIISLLMDHRESIDIIEITPAEGIEPEKTINISITCLLVLKNLIDFKLQRNGTTVVHIQYSLDHAKYRKLNTSKGFDCDLPVANIGYITCWKQKPTCNDVAAYSCETLSAVSETKFIKAKSNLESLKFVKGVKVEGRLVRTFRCKANIGAPFKSHVSFVWIVTKHGKTYNVTKNETIPLASSCYSRVSSDYTFTPLTKDVSDTSITCKTNFGSLTKRISAKKAVRKKR